MIKWLPTLKEVISTLPLSTAIFSLTDLSFFLRQFLQRFHFPMWVLFLFPNCPLSFFFSFRFSHSLPSFHFYYRELKLGFLSYTIDSPSHPLLIQCCKTFQPYRLIPNKIFYYLIQYILVCLKGVLES